jgi:hypothetical protein
METDAPASWYEGKSPVFKFALKFGGWMLLYYALGMTPFSERVFWPANLQANAWLKKPSLEYDERYL